MGRISVLLADDSLIVREGLRALLGMTADLEVVGVAGDYGELVARADELSPQAIVTDIRMPPTFQTEGIDAPRLVRKRHPGNAIAIKRGTTGADVTAAVEQLFLKLAQQATSGGHAGLRNLRRLHQAIVDREEQGERLSRLLPGGIADRVRRDRPGAAETERLT